MNRGVKEEDLLVEQVSVTKPRVSVGKRLRPLLANRVGALVIVNLIFALGAGLVEPNFIRPANFRVIFTEMSMDCILLGAGVMILTSGMFDISIDGVVVLATVVAGKLMGMGWDPLPATLVAMAAGTSVGLANGLFTNVVKVNPLIITLATWWICLGFAFGLTSGVSPFGFPKAFRALGTTKIWGLKIFVWYAVILLPLFWFLMQKTKFGYHVYAMGSNRRSAELHGVKVAQIGIILYVVLAFVSSFVGVVYAARLDTATPILVQGLAMRVISAAVIGGTSVGGGSGSIIGAFLGLLLMNMLMNATVVLGMNPYWQRAILGGVLFLAVVMDWFSKRSRAEAGIGRIGA